MARGSVDDIPTEVDREQASGDRPTALILIMVAIAGVVVTLASALINVLT